MRRHLNRYATHYVCDYETKRVVYGPVTSPDAVAWIRSQGDIEAQSRYINCSRYHLAKRGVYPQNKTGEQQLQEELTALQQGAATDAETAPRG